MRLRRNRIVVVLENSIHSSRFHILSPFIDTVPVAHPSTYHISYMIFTLLQPRNWRPFTPTPILQSALLTQFRRLELTNSLHLASTILDIHIYGANSLIYRSENESSFFDCATIINLFFFLPVCTDNFKERGIDHISGTFNASYVTRNKTMHLPESKSSK